MAETQSPELAPTDSVDAPPRFYCAEVWGGNRPINAQIELPGLRGTLYSRPCRGGRGGDIHYTSICGSGLISRLCLADVAGHGETVAAVSQEIHSLLVRYMNNLDDRRVLRALNRCLSNGEFTAMTTAVSVSYFPPLRRLSVTYAGHPPAWVYRRSEDRWSRLQPASRLRDIDGLVDLPLAIDPETKYTRRRERARVGDRLLLVTDGILEAPSPSGALYGDARLERVLARHHGASQRELADAILASVIEHTQEPRLSHDDVSLLLIEFVPGPRAFGLWHMLRRWLFPRPSGMPARAG